MITAARRHLRDHYPEQLGQSAVADLLFLIASFAGYHLARKCRYPSLLRLRSRAGRNVAKGGIGRSVQM